MQAPTTTGSIVLLTRLARVVYQRSTVELLGMKLTTLGTLAYLRDHPDARQQTVSEALCMDSNTCVLVLNDLEDLELVERRRDPTDRRRHIVDITPQGLEALEMAELAQSTIEDEVLAGLNAEDRATFHRLLVDALESHVAVDEL